MIILLCLIGICILVISLYLEWVLSERKYLQDMMELKSEIKHRESEINYLKKEIQKLKNKDYEVEI